TPMPSASSCVWGLYIDDHQSGGNWESRLFIANVDMRSSHNFAVTVFINGAEVTTPISLAPSAVESLSCGDLRACGAAGGLLIVSDAQFTVATLFIINTIFGSGGFTVQTPVCF